MLPRRVVRVLHAQIGERRRCAGHERRVERAELAHEHRERPAVEGEMVHRQRQAMVFVAEPDQQSAQQRRVLDIERLPGFPRDLFVGALDSLLMSYENGRPGARDPQPLIRRHFERAVQLSGGHKAAPYVAFAETACVRAQDRTEFVASLKHALAIDPAGHPEWRLENRVMQRRARWLLTQTDQLFIESAGAP